MSKVTHSLALLSGKGGTGKTVLALSMSKILGEAGYRVLLVDCDVTTHGATYFFESELDTSKSIISLSALIEDASSKGTPLKTEAGFWFIPSTIKPTDHKAVGSSRNFRIIEAFDKIKEYARDYDVVIFDCQAGYSTVVNKVVDISTKNLIVLEQDAVSSAALRVLYLQIGKKLRASNTWQIFSKLTEEERPVYEKIYRNTFFPNLPPVPFDWQIRAAFATREIPSIGADWSAFGLGVLRIMSALFPELSNTSNQFHDQAVGQRFDTIVNKLERLEAKRDAIKYDTIRKSRKKRINRLRNLNLIIFFFSVVLIAAGIVIVISFPASIARSLLAKTDWIFLLMGGAGVTFAFFWRYSELKGINEEREQDVGQEIITKIEKEAEKYRTLITTDPRRQP